MSTTAPQPVPATTASTTAMSYPERLVKVFVAPTQVFSDLNRKPGWLVPFLLIAIVSLFFVWAVDFKVGFDKVSENQIKQNTSASERMEKLSPEQRAQQMAITTKITRIISYCSPAIALIVFLIIAGLMLGTFNFGFGQQIPFPVALAVIMYASIPGILKTLLSVVALFAGMDPDGFNIQNPLATNLGAFFDMNTSKVLYSVASKIDVFAIWGLALTAIGFAAVSKVKKGSAFGAVFGWYLVYIVFGAAMAAIF